MCRPWSTISISPSTGSIYGDCCHICEIVDVNFTWKADIYGLPTSMAKLLLNSVRSSWAMADTPSATSHSQYHYWICTKMWIYSIKYRSSWKPLDILVTSDMPELVVINEENKTISTLELTMPFECNSHPNYH